MVGIGLDFRIIYNTIYDMNHCKKFMEKNLSQIFLLAFILVLPIVSFAQNTQIVNPLSNVTSIPELIKTVLEGVIKIGMPVIVLAIIYCGFLFVAARGNPESIKKAKSALLYTLIGAAVLLGSWGIAQLITTTITELGK